MFQDVIFIFNTIITEKKLILLPFQLIEKEVLINREEFEKYSNRYLSMITNLSTNTGDLRLFPNLEKVSLMNSYGIHRRTSKLEFTSKKIKNIQMKEFMITEIPFLPTLEILNCLACSYLKNIPTLPNLKYLNCIDCCNITFLPDQPSLIGIKCNDSGFLKVGKTPNLKSIECEFYQHPLTSIEGIIFETMNKEITIRITDRMVSFYNND